MGDFGKNLLAVVIFLSLMAVMLLLLGLQGSGGGPLGWVVSILGAAAWWALIDWVYQARKETQILT